MENRKQLCIDGEITNNMTASTPVRGCIASCSEGVVYSVVVGNSRSSSVWYVMTNAVYITRYFKFQIFPSFFFFFK